MPILLDIAETPIGEFLNIFFHSVSRFLEVHITRPWVIFGTIETIFVFSIMLPISLCSLFIEKFAKKMPQPSEDNNNLQV